jgi:hypothetical protein
MGSNRTESTRSSVLRVRYTVTYKKEPLACMNLPGEDAELTPEALRSLAAALLQVADDCEALHAQVVRYGSTKREYVVSPAISCRCL